MIQIEVTVSPRRIADLIVTAIEGGSTYWCHSHTREAPFMAEVNGTALAHIVPTNMGQAPSRPKGGAAVPKDLPQ